MAQSEMLHLYLHHRNAPKSKGVDYANEWLSESKPKSIGTYAAVAKHCEKAKERNTPIRIHRRKYDASPAVICCECKINSIEPEGHGRYRVFFREHRLLNIPLDKRLQKGWYQIG